MADDFQRYLRREPLLIAPVSRAYRLRKFASRHRAAVSAAALFLAALLVGSVGIAYQWRNAQAQAVLAREQAAVAREEAARAGAIRDFLVSLFDAGDLERSGSEARRPNVDDIVADAGQRLLGDDRLAPSLRADLLLTLAEVGATIGEYDRSGTMLDAVERIQPALGATADEIALRTRLRRVGNLIEQSTTKGAPALALLEPVLPELAQRKDELGFRGLMYQVKALQMVGRDADAGAALDAIARRFGDAADPALAADARRMQVNLAVAAQDYAKAVEHARSGIAHWEAAGRPRTPSTLSMWGDVAIAREGIGDIAGAEDAYRTAISIGDRIYAHPTLDHAHVVLIYGTFLIVQSRVEEAAVQIGRALRMEQAIFGDDDPRIAQAFYSMARLEGARVNYAAAIGWLDRAVVLYAKDGPSTMLARSLAARARFRAQSRRFPEADADMREALATQQALSGDANAAYAWLLDVRADIELREARFEDVLRTTDRVQAITGPAGGAMLQMSLSTRYKRARALAALERTAEAIAEFEDIEPAFARVAPKSGQRFEIAAWKAIAIAQRGPAGDARAAARAALERVSLAHDADPAVVARLRSLAGERSVIGPAHP